MHKHPGSATLVAQNIEEFLFFTIVHDLNFLGFSGGQPFKRHEFVEFPAVLSMERYLYSTQLIKQKSIANLIGSVSNFYHSFLELHMDIFGALTNGIKFVTH